MRTRDGQTVVGAVRDVAMNTSIFTASHYGVVHFGDLDCEAVVLTTGERGYVRKELAKLAAGVKVAV